MPMVGNRPPKTIYTDGREVLYDGNNGNKYYNLKMMPKERQRFCVFVKKLLAKKNMTIVDLAEACNMPTQTCYNALAVNGTQYRGKAVAKIANYLRISRADWYCQVVTEEDLRPGHNGIHIEHTKKYKKAKRKREREKALEEKRQQEAFDSCML